MGGLPWFRPQYVSSVVGNTAKQNLPDVAWCSTSVPHCFAGINASFVSLDGRQASQSCLFTKDSNVSEEVSGVFELWTRLRAIFTTLAYISIDQKDWFGFGECEQFVDQVFHWLHLRHSGLRAPIQSYIEAYISVSDQSQPNAELCIGNPSEYQHFWTV